jgi:hypothetical protein
MVQTGTEWEDVGEELKIAAMLTQKIRNGVMRNLREEDLIPMDL